MPLSPGERIEVKKRIVSTLGQQAWDEIDLTLEEFGFSTSESWDGDAPNYVLGMIRGATDEALAELDGYLHPSEGPSAVPQPTAFDDPANPWVGEGFRLFVSHIHDYAEHVGALRMELAKRSVDAFVAHDSIKPTEEWQNVILSALRSCDACLAFLTPKFRESEWTDQEVGFCIARDVLVIPVDYGVTPYGFLGKYQAHSVKKDHDEADIALAVFELLVRKPQSRDRMARALVDRWSNTRSYNAARENYSFLRRIPAEAWTQALVDEVWSALERNNNLQDASINWQSSQTAVWHLFENLPFSRP
jgi:hypothetical protein